MIVTENFSIDGKPFVRTYSDAGHRLERNGVYYDEAVDPAEFGRTYTEVWQRFDDTEHADGSDI